MNERNRGRMLKRNRSRELALGVHHSAPAEPRDQVVYRDGRRVILSPMTCRLHGIPWQSCTICSKPVKR